MDNLLFRGNTEILVREELEQKLDNSEKLRVKFGIDPTGDRIHLGHASTIRRLKHFQDQGHQVVLIVGSFTGRIGDASDKDSERQILSEEQIKENMRNYEKQLGKIFDVEAAEIHYNHEWFEDMALDEWLRINQLFSVAQMIERDNFDQRYKSGNRIGLQEFQYPLLQGYDSVAVKADVEIGGNDQLFNLMAGRTLQKAYGQSPQNVITYDLLMADDGRKMSKTWANCVWIDDDPDDMFGKVMSINDNLIMHYFELATDVGSEEMASLLSQLKEGNPRDVKLRLGEEIVTIYHDAQAAALAREAWEQQFSQGQLPKDIPEFKTDKRDWDVTELLLRSGLVDSKSEARRMLESGGVKLNGDKLDNRQISVANGDILQAGKRRFVSIKL